MHDVCHSFFCVYPVRENLYPVTAGYGGLTDVLLESESPTGSDSCSGKKKNELILAGFPHHSVHDLVVHMAMIWPLRWTGLMSQLGFSNLFLRIASPAQFYYVPFSPVQATLFLDVSYVFPTTSHAYRREIRVVAPLADPEPSGSDLYRLGN